MISRFIFLLLVVAASSCSEQKNVLDETDGIHIANYQIDCRFDPQQHVIHGLETLQWRNTSTQPVSELQFHLYMNAFRDEQSTFLRELGSVAPDLRDNWGYCYMQQVRTADGTDLTGGLRFIQPDDGNKADQTVAALRLEQPVYPGEWIELQIEFETRLPYLTERSGFRDDFNLVCQWFPKIGVLEEDGWNCHQYHANSEFYADFGRYNVSITLPDSYIVGATGSLTQKRLLSDRLQKVRFQAERVHDFAWVASPHLRERHEKIDDLDIRLLYLPHNEAMADRYIASAAAAYRYCSSAYGRYPYPRVTIVDCPLQNAVMEYPMFFLTGNFGGSADALSRSEPVPEYNRFPERLTMHEFAHMWWYGIVANNEAEEAWLDEGFADFSAAKAFEKAYGPALYPDIDGRPVPIRAFKKEGYLARPSVAKILAPAWEHPSWSEYYLAAYVKPKLLLHTLDNYFGEEVWGQVMATYYQRWQFKHPNSEDFLAVVKETVPGEWNKFFQTYLETTAFLDYAIGSTGQNQVEIINNGQLFFPVEIHFKFSDGSRLIREWKAEGTSISYDFSERPPLVEVLIDPRGIIEFEIDRSNNNWRQ